MAKTKIASLLILAVILIPSVALAATSVGFSLSIGSGSGGGGWNVGNYMGFGLPAGSITGIILNILLWILYIFGIIGVIGFVIAGIMYLTAAGEEDRMESAKKAMYYSIIGVIVGLVGVVILQAVNLALNSSSNF
ncbi:MAG: hypothetical protein WC608_03105 [Parcubacteria group bacterium]